MKYFYFFPNFPRLFQKKVVTLQPLIKIDIIMFLLSNSSIFSRIYSRLITLAACGFAYQNIWLWKTSKVDNCESAILFYKKIPLILKILIKSWFRRKKNVSLQLRDKTSSNLKKQNHESTQTHFISVIPLFWRG